MLNVIFSNVELFFQNVKANLDLRENSLEGLETNHASFYGPEKMKRPFVAYFLFSFSSMALPLDPLAESVRHGIYWTELPLPLPHTPPMARPHLPHPIP